MTNQHRFTCSTSPVIETSNENIKDTKVEVRQPEVSRHAALIGIPRKEPAANSEPQQKQPANPHWPTRSATSSTTRLQQTRIWKHLTTKNHTPALHPHQHGRDPSTESTQKDPTSENQHQIHPTKNTKALDTQQKQTCLLMGVITHYTLHRQPPQHLRTHSTAPNQHPHQPHQPTQCPRQQEGTLTYRLELPYPKAADTASVLLHTLGTTDESAHVDLEGPR
jgi:hypothetical protein